LLVGAQFAKSLSLALNKPLLAVHHMQAHVLANLIAEPKPSFPFLCLTVSGGHTQIVLCESPVKMRVIGETSQNPRPIHFCSSPEAFPSVDASYFRRISFPFGFEAREAE
jgi:hypothetical protein